MVASFLFAGEDRYRTHFMCVVLGVDETKVFCGLSACWLEGLSKACLCFGLFCCVACCWVSRAARLLFYRITPSRQDPLVGVVWGGVLCENCIVDANAIKKQQLMVVVCFFFFVVLFLVFFVVCA